jgi:hypothetical protein
MTPRHRHITALLAQLTRKPCGWTEEYASIVQGHSEAARDLVAEGAPFDRYDYESIANWARAELARDEADDLVAFEVVL